MRLIDADALKEKLDKLDVYIDCDENLTTWILSDEVYNAIDNAPTVENITIFCENADEKTVEDLKNELTQDLINKITVNAGLAQPIKEERPQNDIRWTDKVSVTSSGDIIDFEGRVVGHINLEDIKGGDGNE